MKMDNNNTARVKSKKFAIKIIALYQNLVDGRRELVMSKQVLRSGTSIGANLAESEFACSSNDFLSKIYIALKETGETIYWLELLHETGYIDDETYTALYSECDELRRMLSATTKTITSKIGDNN